MEPKFLYDYLKKLIPTECCSDQLETKRKRFKIRNLNGVSKIVL